MNLIIAGVGGQGVNLLTRAVAQTCRAAGRLCQYTIHKGGAQSLGTVFGELRFLSTPEQILAPGIPPGKLDILLALDAWEALRHLPLAHAASRILVERELASLYTGHQHLAPQAEAFAALEQCNAQWRDYRQQAIQKYGDANMANYLAGVDCLHALNVVDLSEYERLFTDIVSKKGRL